MRALPLTSYFWARVCLLRPIPFKIEFPVRGDRIMSKKMWRLLVLGLAFIVSMAVSQVDAQKEMTGTWKSSISDKGARINLHFERSFAEGRKSQTGQTYDFSELQSLTREQVDRGGPVKFSLVREAGTIECEGAFENGKGSGTFRFIPNPAFVSGMKSRGFDFE